MNYSIKRITLDILSVTAQAEIRWKKGDTARRIEATLMENGAPYTISDGCYVVFTATKPDGNIIYNNCIVEDNRIIYDVTPQTTASPGFVKCEFKVYGNNDELITCPRFLIVVDDTVYDEGDLVESATEVEALTTLVNGTRELISDIEERLENDEFRGEPGVSPDVSVSEIDGGHRVTVTDNDGAEHFDVLNGEKGETGSIGPQGPPGKPGAPGAPGVSVMDYGAVGDGVADDTAAFREALAAERVLFVPGGTYMLSGTIVIGENCEMMLSQDTVLRFMQTDEHCIAMKRIASIRGNHATIFVPYTFNANVIHASTDVDVSTNADGEIDNTVVPPFTKWDPQWKMSRYVTDLNICKPDSRGFHYSVDGNCYGTAVYLNCSSEDPVTFMWGVDMSGLRIAGGFTYGIHILNEGSAWNHDMRVEAVIDACETGVSVENCNNAHLAVTIQPRRSYSMDGVYAPYAKYGIKLKNSRCIDLSSSAVWDWNTTNTLIGTNSEYQHIAMYGDCSGVNIYDFSTVSSNYFWQTIYYDNIVSMLNATVIGAKGRIPIDPKYAFYKNFRQGNYAFSSGNLSWRDPHNMSRYDVPVTPLNGWANPNRLYRIGHFTIGTDVENPPSDDYDTLTNQTVTVEENNYFGICGWSNLHYENGALKHFWSPLPSVYESRVPIYYYTVDNDRYTIFRLVTDAYDIQQIYNCRVTITNARRFIFDFADVGTIGDLDTGTYIRIDPQIQGGAPRLAGQYGSDGKKPLFCTTGTAYNADGSEASAAVNLQLVTEEDIADLAIKSEQVDFIIDADGEYITVPDFTDAKSPYQVNVWDNNGTMATVTNSIYIEPRSFKVGDIVRIKGVDFANTYPGKPRAYMYSISDGSYKNVVNLGSLISNSNTGSFYNNEATYEWDGDNYVLTVTFNGSYASAMLSSYSYGFGGYIASGYSADTVIMTVNEKIIYKEIWQGEPKRLDGSIYAQNAILTSPNGTVYKLTVSDDGTVSAETFT